MSKRNQKKLGFCFWFSSCQKSSETVVLFYNSESTFDLNRTVHSQNDPFFRRDVRQGLSAFFQKSMRNSQRSTIIFGFMAAFTVGTACTAVISIIRSLDFYSVFRFCFFFVQKFQFTAVRTDEAVFVTVVFKMFHTEFIFLVGSFLACFVVLRFDICRLLVIFQIYIVFLTLVACVSNYIEYFELVNIT